MPVLGPENKFLNKSPGVLPVQNLMKDLATMKFICTVRLIRL